MYDPAGARALLESIAAEQPNLAALHYELGLLLAEMGQTQAAISSLSRVVELEPGHPAARRPLGDQRAAVGDLEGAGKAYARHFQSSLADVPMLEQTASLGQEQLEIALALLREFLNVHPTDVNALQMMELLRAPENQSARASGRRLSAVLSEASQKVGSDLAAAAALSNGILAAVPGQQQALLLLVSAFRMCNELEQACAALQAMGKFHPNLASIQYELGPLLGALGRQQEGSVNLSKVAELEPIIPRPGVHLEMRARR